MKKTLNLLLIAAIVLFTNCKKGDTGPQGDKGEKGATGATGEPGPTAKYYDFQLSFGPTATTNTYNAATGTIYNKAVIVYIDKGYKDWVQLPYTLVTPGYVSINFVPTIDEVLEKIQIETVRADSQTGSPWATNVNRSFRAVTINFAAKGANYNYNDIKKLYNLPD